MSEHLKNWIGANQRTAISVSPQAQVVEVQALEEYLAERACIRDGCMGCHYCVKGAPNSEVRKSE